MANTYEIIASVNVGSGGAASIDFTSIPSTYTDLLLSVSLRSTEATVETNATISFNGSGANKSARTLYGNGSTASSFTYASEIYLWLSGANSTASTFGNSQYYIPNYASSNNKSISIDSTSENNGTLVAQSLTAGLWANSSAITSITITCGGGNFVQYSTAYLYGISNA
jgi:hypothetical protein